jgi:hypothetical protein
MTITEEHRQIFAGKICPYCKSKTQLIDSRVVYNGKSFGKIYACLPCDAWVGLHKGTSKALGRLANHELREAKKEAHHYFDMIWQQKHMKRKEAYAWLSEKLSIPSEFTHIGMFSPKTCKEVVRLSKQFLNDMRRIDLDFGAEPKTSYYAEEEN